MDLNSRLIVYESKTLAIQPIRTDGFATQNNALDATFVVSFLFGKMCVHKRVNLAYCGDARLLMRPTGVQFSIPHSDFVLVAPQ